MDWEAIGTTTAWQLAIGVPLGAFLYAIRIKPRTNMSKNTRPEIGQECVCPDGVGRVVEVFDGPAGSMRVHVSTYVNDRGCHWDRQNVRLIAINYQE